MRIKIGIQIKIKKKGVKKGSQFMLDRKMRHKIRLYVLTCSLSRQGCTLSVLNVK